MKYTHRISVNAGICFDLETDNETPTVQEVDAAVGDLIDGADVPELEGGRVYLKPTYDTEGFSHIEFEVDDTVENKTESEAQ